jgi:hypothetical protein
MKLRWRERSDEHSSPGLPPDFRMPKPQQPATLVMPDGVHLPARIAGSEGQTLLVLAMVRLEAGLGGERLQQIVLELSGGKGVLRLGGTITLQDGELLRFANLHSIDVVQRREYVRVRATRSVQILLDGSSAAIESYSVDLSGGGMLLGGLDHVRVGERISFRLATEPDGASASQITGTGRVVRSDPGGRRAIAFDSISEGDRRRLIKFLFECQREERRKGLRVEGSNGR